MVSEKHQKIGFIQAVQVLSQTLQHIGAVLQALKVDGQIGAGRIAEGDGGFRRIRHKAVLSGGVGLVVLDGDSVSEEGRIPLPLLQGLLQHPEKGFIGNPFPQVVRGVKCILEYLI